MMLEENIDPIKSDQNSSNSIHARGSVLLRNIFVVYKQILVWEEKQSQTTMQDHPTGYSN